MHCADGHPCSAPPGSAIRRLLILLSATSAPAAAGCDTTEGLRQAVEAGGEAIEDVAEAAVGEPED